MLSGKRFVVLVIKTNAKLFILLSASYGIVLTLIMRVIIVSVIFMRCCHDILSKMRRAIDTVQRSGEQQSTDVAICSSPGRRITGSCGSDSFVSLSLRCA